MKCLLQKYTIIDPQFIFILYEDVLMPQISLSACFHPKGGVYICLLWSPSEPVSMLTFTIWYLSKGTGEVDGNVNSFSGIWQEATSGVEKCIQCRSAKKLQLLKWPLEAGFKSKSFPVTPMLKCPNLQ